MTETAKLVIKVDSSGADRATRSLDKLDRAAGSNERAANKLGKAWGIALGIIGSGVVAVATREYIRASDAMANMSSRLKLVAGSAEGAAKAQKQLFDLSQATSQDLEATTDLYVKLGQSNKDLAADSELLLGITEKVSKALVISGADAASSAAVIRQFSQAMGAGALRGDEFISVMEGAPRLAQAIADGMGVAVGSLRDMAADGKLTSDVIVKALENQGQVLDREFGEMPLTVGRATQQVRNALTQLIGDTDKATGASGDLAEAIADLARVLESDETKQAFATTVSGIASITAAMVEGTAKAKEYHAELFRNSELGQKLSEEGKWGTGLKYFLFGGAPDFSNVRDGRERWANVTSGSGTRQGGATESATTSIEKQTRAIRDNSEAKRRAILDTSEFDRATMDFEETQRDWQRRLEDITAQLDGPYAMAALEYRRAIEELNAAKARGAVTAEDAAKWEAALAEQYQRSVGAVQGFTDALEDDGWENATQDLQYALADLGVDAAMNFGRAGDAVEQFGERMKRVALQMLADRAVQWLIGAMFGGNFAGAETVGNGDTAFGFSSYGGGRASGGPVMAGQSYLVGEKGRPEIFTPGTSGTISQSVPAAKSAPTIVQVINHSGSQARTERGKTPEGGDFIKVIIDQAVGKVNENIMRQGGSTGRAIQSAFGLSRSGVPVSG